MAIYRDEWADEVREGVDGLSYQQAASKIGCSKAYISEWLQKKVPSRAMVLAYARGLGRNVNQALAAAGYELEPEHEPAPGKSGAQVLLAGLERIDRDYGGIGKYRFRGGISEITPEEAVRELWDIENEIREERGLPLLPEPE